MSKDRYKGSYSDKHLSALPDSELAKADEEARQTKRLALTAAGVATGIAAFLVQAATHIPHVPLTPREGVAATVGTIGFVLVDLARAGRSHAQSRRAGRLLRRRYEIRPIRK